ncbi:hypothetical protein [Proteiniphilum acetatigenes]|nr:hypothetical protein [Proteiniphilum acetatigenes]
MTADRDQKEVKEAYEKPAIEVIEMETEHPILQSSGDGWDNGGVFP